MLEKYYLTSYRPGKGHRLEAESLIHLPALSTHLIPPFAIAMEQGMLWVRSMGVGLRLPKPRQELKKKKSSADSGSFKQLHTYLAVMIAQVTPIIKRIITCFAKIPRK